MVLAKRRARSGPKAAWQSTRSLLIHPYPLVLSPTRVIHFQRRPVPGHFSMEAVFGEIADRFPEDLSVSRVTCWFTSQGIIRRLLCIGQAFWRQQAVNHITGDVHFLALGLPRRSSILTIHDCVPLHNHPNGLKHAILKLFWFTLPVKRVALVTLVSEATKNELLSHVPVRS